MRLSSKTALLSIPLMLSLLLPVAVAQSLPANSAKDERTGMARALHDLFAREWERTLRENPTFASALGDRRYNDQWGDRSPETYRARAERTRTALAD